MQTSIPLYTVGLLLIKNRKLLLAYSKNKECFYLPGGKVDTGETNLSALVRESKEELNITITENDLLFYTHISAPAYGELQGVVMEQDCFLLTTYSTPVASAEIGEIGYFTLKEYLQQPNTAPGAVAIMQLLKRDNKID